MDQMEKHIEHTGKTHGKDLSLTVSSGGTGMGSQYISMMKRAMGKYDR